MPVGLRRHHPDLCRGQGGQGKGKEEKGRYALFTMQKMSSGRIFGKRSRWTTILYKVWVEETMKHRSVPVAVRSFEVYQIE